MQRLHRAIPKTPTWSTCIFTDASTNVVQPLTLSDTKKLAKLAAIECDQSYVKALNDFATLVDPILLVDCDVEPLVSIVSDLNAMGIQNDQKYHLPPKETDLVKLSKKSMDGYYLVEKV